MLQRVMSRFFSKNFCLPVPKHSVEEPSEMFFRNVLVAEKFMDKRGRGVSRFSLENFLSRSAEKFRRGTLLCFTNLGYGKMLGISR